MSKNQSLLLRQTAKLLKEIRLEAGLSLEKLARKSGIDRTFISGIERSNRSITLNTLHCLLQALEIESEYFLIRLASLLR